MEVFDTLGEAQFLIESWREHYNTERPHSALKYLSPARFIEQWQENQEALRQTA